MLIYFKHEFIATELNVLQGRGTVSKERQYPCYFRQSLFRAMRFVALLALLWHTCWYGQHQHVTRIKRERLFPTWRPRCCSAPKSRLLLSHFYGRKG